MSGIPKAELEDITGIMSRSGIDNWAVIRRDNPYSHIKIRYPSKRLAGYLMDCGVPFEYQLGGIIRVRMEFISGDFVRDDYGENSILNTAKW
jgi:hypothetical protein